MSRRHNKKSIIKTFHLTLCIAFCCGIFLATFTQISGDETKEFELSSIKREAWILQQSDELYTVQVSAFNKEKSAIDFITSNDLQNDAALFRVSAGDKALYKAIYKTFTTRKEAARAVEELARRIPEQAPWLRQFSDIQREIHGIMGSKVTDSITDRSVAAVLRRGQSAFNQQDYVRAVELWTPLAEQGVAEAQYALGFMYESGWGVKKDYTQAFNWYEKAATLGHAKAQYNLGLLYMNGFGVGKDLNKGRHWVQSAAEQKDRRALDFLEENQVHGVQ